MYILGIKDWLLALFIYLLDGDIFLANSHEQNMMPALLWTWFAFSYTSELICSTFWKKICVHLLNLELQFETVALSMSMHVMLVPFNMSTYLIDI